MNRWVNLHQNILSVHHGSSILSLFFRKHIINKVVCEKETLKTNMYHTKHTSGYFKKCMLKNKFDPFYKSLNVILTILIGIKMFYIFYDIYYNCYYCYYTN